MPAIPPQLVGEASVEERGRQHADFVTEDDVVASQEIARVHRPRFEEHDGPLRSGEFLPRDGRDDPRGLQRDDGDEEFGLHTIGSGCGGALMRFSIARRLRSR